MYFILQALAIYYRKALVKSRGYLEIVKNRKMYCFIRYHLDLYEVKNGEELEFIELEEQFRQLNQEVVRLCQKEIKMIERFMNPSLEFSAYRDLLK